MRERAGERGSSTHAFDRIAEDKAESVSPSAEIVATREAGDIVFYIDDWASNAPLTSLQVDVVSGAQRLRAAADARGGYRLPADLLEASAMGTVTVQYRGRGIEGVATVALATPAPAAATPSPTRQAERPRPSTRIAGFGLSALVLLATIWTLHHRHRRLGNTGPIAPIP